MTEVLTNGHIENGEFEPITPVTNQAPAMDIPIAKLGEINVSNYMRESLDKVAVSEGFRNYELVFDHGSNIGDGFVGQILKVVIKENDSDKILKVLAKIPPESLARREQMGTMKLFQREVDVYNILLPEFVQFQKERNINQSMGFFNFPKVYFADYCEEKDDAIIIMEDLRDSGYRMWDKTKPINYEHSKLFLVSLGRLHAIAFAMKLRKPEQFEKFKLYDDFLTRNLNDPNFTGFLQASVVRAADYLEEGDVKKKEKVLKVAENIIDVLKFCLNPEEAEPFSIITHGDCWFNNFVYHYKRKDLPDEIVLIDWQVSRYVSPVIDLVYFIFMCTDHHLRAKYYDEFLNIYHNSLKELLDHLGGDTMTQFPFTALLRQVKKYGKLGIITACMAIPMFQTKSEEMPDMDFMAEKMKNADPKELEEMGKAFAESMKHNQDGIVLRTRGVLLDAIKYGFF